MSTVTTAHEQQQLKQLKQQQQLKQERPLYVDGIYILSLDDVTRLGMLISLMEKRDRGTGGVSTVGILEDILTNAYSGQV